MPPPTKKNMKKRNKRMNGLLYLKVNSSKKPE
jgi:hypothetical protein